MVSFFYGQSKCDDSGFVNLQRYYHRFHTWMVSFFHELKKCDIWRIVLLKSNHHKTHIWKTFSPHEQMQCGLQTYFHLKKYQMQISHLNDIFLSWTEDTCDLTGFLTEKCVSQISHLNIFFSCFFNPWFSII